MWKHSSLQRRKGRHAAIGAPKAPTRAAKVLSQQGEAREALFATLWTAISLWVALVKTAECISRQTSRSARFHLRHRLMTLKTLVVCLLFVPQHRLIAKSCSVAARRHVAQLRHLSFVVGLSLRLLRLDEKGPLTVNRLSPRLPSSKSTLRPSLTIVATLWYLRTKTVSSRLLKLHNRLLSRPRRVEERSDRRLTRPRLRAKRPERILCLSKSRSPVTSMLERKTTTSLQRGPFESLDQSRTQVPSQKMPTISTFSDRISRRKMKKRPRGIRAALGRTRRQRKRLKQSQVQVRPSVH